MEQTKSTGHPVATDRAAMQAYAVVTVAVFLWAVGLIIGRAVHAEIPPVGLTFWRWLIASLAILPFAWGTLIRHRRVLRAHLGILSLQGVLIVGPSAAMFLALNFTTAINATLITATQPTMTVLLARIFVGDRPRAGQWAGVASAFIGVALMVTQADWRVFVTLDFNIGDLIGISAIVGYSLYAINLRKLPAELGTFPALAAIVFIGAILLSPLYIYESMALRPVPFTWNSVLVIAVVAVVISALSMAMWNYGNRTVGHNRAAVFVNLVPVFGAVLGILFLDEQLHGYHLAGGALVCSGIFLVARDR